ncbi:MAG: hypothetical protein GY943_10730 [Chloroflexi bacterium]|nr:hypothetical protein [Chloroflexota bacterium]
MQDIIFTGTTQVDIRGNTLLNCIHTQGDRTAYELLGFEDGVSLIDCRPTNTIHTHPTPAHLTIHMTETAVLQFTLHETPATTATHMLWMSTGNRTTTPPHEQLFMQIAPLQNGRYAYLALCQMPKPS